MKPKTLPPNHKTTWRWRAPLGQHESHEPKNNLQTKDGANINKCTLSYHKEYLIRFPPLIHILKQTYINTQ